LEEGTPSHAYLVEFDILTGSLATREVIPAWWLTPFQKVSKNYKYGTFSPREF
jgi:hypothetical protein